MNILPMIQSIGKKKKYRKDNYLRNREKIFARQTEYNHTPEAKVKRQQYYQLHRDEIRN